MTTVVTHFIKMLEHQGSLEWYRVLGGPDEKGRVVPPLIVWRYKAASDTEGRVKSAVKSYRGEIDWLIERPGRNWVLVPQKVVDTQRQRSLPSDSAAIRVLVDEDQTFCVAALEDFGKLLKHVANSLLSGNGRPF